MRLPVRSLFALVLAGAVLVGTVTYTTRDTAAPVSTTRRVVTVGLGDVVVTVGGVGRIVTAGSTSALAPSAAAGSASSTSPAGQAGGAGPALPGALFPRAAGVVSRILVAAGDKVVPGQRIALLDDGGAALGAVQQASADLATAAITLRRMLDPLTPADVSSLRLDARRAQADLETLRGGGPGDRARAVRLARRAVALAGDRLDLVLRPRTAADIAAAEAEARKAEADLAALTAPRPPAPAAELAAAEAAVRAAAARLAALTLPADPVELAAAQADMRRAQADLSALTAPAPPPSAAALASAQQSVAAALSKVASLRLPVPAADVTAARLELQRSRYDLQTLRSGPNPAALAAARAALVAARARLGAPPNPLDVELARVTVASAGARLSAARLGRDLLTVRAVSGGTVTSVLVRRGSPVDPSTPVAAVSDLERLAVDVDVSEFDAAQVRPGMRAVLSVDALGGKRFPGTVVFAALIGAENGGVVTFPVRVRLGAVDDLKPGMNVSVRIVVDERRQVVRVPVEAVSRAGEGGSRIAVLRGDGRVSQRIVELGLANNKMVEVVDGLRAGQRIVLAGKGGGGRG